MANEDNWQKVFPDAAPSDAIAHIDGDSYFGAVAKALATAKGADDLIVIMGWMLDVVPDKQKANATYLQLVAALEAAVDRDVNVIIHVWNNPTYISQINQLKWWATFRSFRKNLWVQTHEPAYGPSEPKALFHTFNNLMRAIANNAKPTAISTPDTMSTILHLQTLRGSPSAQQISDWLADINYNIGAHHEKNVFVRNKEGLIGFCGGIDFNLNRIKPAATATNSHYYHDAAIEVKGRAAFQILQECMYRIEETIWGSANRKKLQALLKSAEQTIDVSSGPLSVKIVGTYNSPTNYIKIRSVSEAYLAILGNARKYVYIEDQYMVNLNVAEKINKLIQKDEFDFAMFVVQDSDETGDILIPNRKRLDFLKAVTKGIADKKLLDKVRFVVIDKDKTKIAKYRYHPGLHSKLMVVDDEIAIVGSCNINNRSFTLDSETSAVVFGGDFAKNLRINLWADTIQGAAPSDAERTAGFDDWKTFPKFIGDPKSNSDKSLDFLNRTYLKNYNLGGHYRTNKVDPNKEDLDEVIIKWIDDNPIKSWLLSAKDVEDLVRDVWTMGGAPQISVSDVVDNPRKYIPKLIDIAWEHVLDPYIP